MSRLSRVPPTDEALVFGNGTAARNLRPATPNWRVRARARGESSSGVGRLCGVGIPRTWNDVASTLLSERVCFTHGASGRATRAPITGEAGGGRGVADE